MQSSQCNGTCRLAQTMLFPVQGSGLLLPYHREGEFFSNRSTWICVMLEVMQIRTDENTTQGNGWEPAYCWIHSASCSPPSPPTCLLFVFPTIPSHCTVWEWPAQLTSSLSPAFNTWHLTFLFYLLGSIPGPSIDAWIHGFGDTSSLTKQTSIHMLQAMRGVQYVCIYRYRCGQPQIARYREGT